MRKVSILFWAVVVATVTATMAAHAYVIPIDNISQLQQIGNDPGYPLDADYILMQDIDASATADWNSGEGFLPIGFYPSSCFTGHLEGQGYKIINLSISRPGENYVGLFRCVGTGGEVTNLSLQDASVTGDRLVGSLVGHNYGGTVTACHATGAIAGDWYVGGLVGKNYNGGTVTGCSSACTITGDDYLGSLVGYNGGASSTVASCYATGSVTGGGVGSQYIGGLVGNNYEGTVTQSYATGAVTGYDKLGGLVGLNSSGTISLSYATGTVTTGDNGGGLLGYNNTGSVTACYATGNVFGNVWLGGLIGGNTGSATNCYARGAVAGDDYVGGLVGWNIGGTLTTSYATGAISGGPTAECLGGLVGVNTSGGTAPYGFWDMETSGQSTSPLGTGLTTVEMMQETSFECWDFTSTWTINEGFSYPYLVSVDGGFVVVSPNGGEEWGTGTFQDITWEPRNGPGPDVRIGLLKGGVFQDWIKRSTENDGSWTWVVPEDIDPGDDYKIRVQSYTDSTIRDDSDSFFTVGPIAVVSPNGLEEWEMGSVYEIRWASHVATVGADVRVGLHLGTTFLNWITLRTDNDKGYFWKIPTDLTPGYGYRVRVQSYTDSDIRDLSDVPFSLVQAPLVVTSPDLHDELFFGGTYTVTWDCNDMGAVGANVRIGLHKGGAFVDWIVRKTPNDNTFSWTVGDRVGPILSAPSYRLRLQSYTDTSVRTMSPAFTITAPIK